MKSIDFDFETAGLFSLRRMMDESVGDSASRSWSLFDEEASLSWSLCLCFVISSRRLPLCFRSLFDDEAISLRWWSSRRLSRWLSSTADGGSPRWLRRYLSLDGWHEKESLDLSLRIYLRRKQNGGLFSGGNQNGDCWYSGKRKVKLCFILVMS